MSTTVYKGPAQVTFGGSKFQSQGEVTVTQANETFDVMTDYAGSLDRRLKSRLFNVSFTPSGQIAGEALAFIIAAGGRTPGTSVMGGNLVIEPFISGQEILTFARGGITQLPGLRLGASKTLFGQMTFAALEAAGASTGVIATPSSYSAPTNTFAPENILTESWLGTYAPAVDPGDETELTSFFTDLETEDGWEIATELSVEPSRVDSLGINDYTHKDFKVNISCKPVGLTATQILAILQRSATTSGSNRRLRPGDSITGMKEGVRQNNVLTLTSRSGYVIEIQNCGINAGSLAYGSSANRTPSLSLTAVRSFTSGAIDPLITYSAP